MYENGAVPEPPDEKFHELTIDDVDSSPSHVIVRVGGSEGCAMSVWGDSPESMSSPSFSHPLPHSSYSNPTTPSRVLAPPPAGVQSAYRSVDPLQRLRGSSRNARTAQWMEQQYFSTVGPQTSSATPSNAPSVMSGVSAVSIGAMSQLSICTTFTEAAAFARADSSTASSASSTVENVDPRQAPEFNKMIQRMIQGLVETKSIDHERAVNTVCQFAIRGVYRIAQPALLQQLFLAIAHTIRNPASDSQIVFKLLGAWLKMCRCSMCMQALDSIEVAHKAVLTDAICGRLDAEARYMESAVTVLRILLVRPHVGQQFRRFARREDTVIRLLRILSHPLQINVKHLVLDTLRYLVNKNNDIKEFLRKNGGLRAIWEVLRSESDEKILFSATYLLNSVLTSNNKVFADEFLRIGGVQVLAPHLAHGSPRFLLETLKALMALTVVETLRQVPVQPALEGVLRLLGSSEPTIVSYCVAFIFRSGAFHPHNPLLQEFMIRENAVHEVMRVLEVILQQHVQGGAVADPRTTQGIVDNAMGVLAGFMYDSTIARVACEQMTKRPTAKTVLVNMLAGSIPVTRKNAALILARIFAFFPGFTGVFVDVFDDYRQQSVAANAFFLLCDAALQMERTEHAEEYHCCKEYVAVCLELLQRVVQQPELAQQVQLHVRNTRNFLLCLMNGRYEGLEMPILSFCDRLLSPNPIHPSPTYTDDPYSLSHEWAASDEIVRILENYSMHAVPEIAEMARRVYAHLRTNNFAASQMKSTEYDVYDGSGAGDAMSQDWTSL